MSFLSTDAGNMLHSKLALGNVFGQCGFLPEVAGAASCGMVETHRTSLNGKTTGAKEVMGNFKK